jgi:hypothetical protein
MAIASTNREKYCQRPRHQHQTEGAEQATPHRSPHAEPNGPAGLTVAGHGKAVEGRGNGGRRAWNADQTTGNEPARRAADIDAGHGREPGQRIEPVGEGQDHDHGHRDRHAGQRAAHHAHQGADEQRQQVFKLQDVDDGAGQLVEHDYQPVQLPRGSSTDK